MSEELLRKATEMRNAIDMIEGALMGLGDFVDLPDLFEGTAEHVNLAPKMTVGELRRVCTALAECTRIINSEEFAPDELRRHAQRAPWQPIDTIPQDRPVDGWHSVWKCPVTIAYRSWGDRNAWVEKTLTTEWPLEAFTHWRETSKAPSLTSTECAPPKAWTEAKAEIDAGWPDDPATAG